jgi:hypothetical protein
MDTSINNKWECHVEYTTVINNLNDKSLFISNINAEEFFRSLLSDEDLKNIWKAKRLVCAEYTKVLVDAFFEGLLDENLLAISIALIESNSFLNIKEFVTQRLVGKKRKEFVFELQGKIHVCFGSNSSEANEPGSK